MDESTLDCALLKALSQVLGVNITAATPVERGFTSAKRLRLLLDNGQRRFVKIATSDETEQWLAAEWQIYSNLHRSFMPQAYGFVEIAVDRHALILEDLAEATWVPQWKETHVESVVVALRELHQVRLAVPLPRLRDNVDISHAWKQLAAGRAITPESLGFSGPEWTALCALDGAALLEGNDLLHCDVRSDNLCFRDQQCVLFDWNWACTGNGRFDFAGWLPSLQNEGGQLPVALVSGCLAEIVLMAGFFLNQASKLPVPHAPTLREFQRKQGEALLPYVRQWLE